MRTKLKLHYFIKIRAVIAKKKSVIFSNNISKIKSRKNHHTAKKEENQHTAKKNKKKYHATGEEQKSRYRQKSLQNKTKIKKLTK